MKCCSLVCGYFLVLQYLCTLVSSLSPLDQELGFHHAF